VSPGARNALPWLYQSVVVSPPVQQNYNNYNSYNNYNNYYYYAYADPVSPPVAAAGAAGAAAAAAAINLINNNIENGGGLIQMDINNLLQFAINGPAPNQS
jgi:hypothetical protein